MTDFAATRAAFDLPEGVTYLDGNSLGPLPKAAPERVAAAMTAEWGARLIRGWNECGWMAAPTALGDRVGRLIGAPAGTTVLGDTLSVKVYQALASALEMREGRGIVLSDTGNFPSDLYMAEGLIRSLGRGHELRLVAPEDVEDAIDDRVAVLMLTECDYRTGRRHDMRALTAKAHAAGALTVWDLAHSAGAIPVDVTAAGADFAVGCTYKFLNGGPGAPAFIHVAERHLGRARPALSGWLGHEAPFAFDLDYRAGAGIERMRVGTPPILQLAALEAALDVWDGVDMAALDARRAALGNRLIAAVEGSCEGVTLASPRDAAARGSQISFRHPDAYAVMQALIARGVIGDFRAPDILRFGLAPLYNDAADMDRAAATLADILSTRAYDAPEFAARKAVT
ncbi:MAG: kynureninase [Hasllibacter sp.]